MKSIHDIASGYRLTVETAVIPGHENAFRVYKGVNPVFVGTEEAVREFLDGYERPGLYEGSIYNYKE